MIDFDLAVIVTNALMTYWFCGRMTLQCHEMNDTDRCAILLCCIRRAIADESRTMPITDAEHSEDTKRMNMKCGASERMDNFASLKQPALVSFYIS